MTKKQKKERDKKIECLCYLTQTLILLKTKKDYQRKRRKMNIDYNNMNFTDKDREQLKSNRNQIVQWIMENIVPMLTEDEKIYVDFGGKYSCPRSSSVTDNYHFAVYGREYIFMSGGGRKTKGYVGYGEKFGGISQAFETTCSPYEIYPIMDNWKEIKNSLVTRLKQIQEYKGAIYQFSI